MASDAEQSDERPECCTRYADAVFVFGSNLAGRHGAGAALHAREHHGAVYGMCVGEMGASYAIPTKGVRMQTLPLESIMLYVVEFLEHTRECPAHRFYVTAIGTGLAGYSHADIALMFKDAPPNCILPEEWIPWTRPNQEDAP